ncbi:MAG: VIT1/CCC1 transporter family protein [Chitinophagaceae bacterium]
MSFSHKEPHIGNGSTFISDIVIGMSDGLTVPFALAAGVSSAVSDTHIVTTAGIAELVAGAISMGLGGYLAGKTELEHYAAEKKNEYYEVETIPEKEKQEVRDIFAGFGLSSEVQELAANEIIQDKDKWVDFMMQYELGLSEPDPRRATKSAANIGLSYVAGGIVPLLPYFFVDTPMQGLKISAIVAICCLFVFGWFKSKATGQPLLSGAVRVTVIGAIAAAAAFLVAKFFEA